MKKPIVAAELEFLIEYAKNQFAESFGLHLNSSSWKPYIKVGKPVFYKFLIDGIVQFSTKTSTSNKKYNQTVKLMDYKKIEPALFVLFLLKLSDEEISNFISEYLMYANAKIRCDCPAFGFWGPAFNLTHLQSIYGLPEKRPPRIRDKKRENLICKHLWLVLETFESNIKYFAKGLLPYYKRMFGLYTDTDIDKTIRKFNDKQIRKLVEDASISLTESKNKTLTDKFIKLTENKINDLIKLNKSISLKPEIVDNINDIVKKDTIKKTTDNWIKEKTDKLAEALEKDYTSLMNKKRLAEKNRQILLAAKEKELINDFLKLFNDKK